MKQLATRRVFLGCAATLVLSAAGCGGGADTPPLATVEGVITRDGQPVPNAVVEFYPEKGRRSSGTTNPQGRYDLQYMVGERGALLGMHRVTFSLPPQLSPKQLAQAEKLKDGEKAEYIRRAGEPSPIKHEEKAEVKAGKNEISFDLTGKK